MTELSDPELVRPEPPRSIRRTVLSGGSWLLLPQVTSLAVNLALTPFVLHGLGIARYGLYLFAATAAQFVGTFDGGITASAQRFFATFAGARDRVATTRLLTTLVVVTTVLGAAVLGVLWLLAPPIVDHLHMAAELRGEGTFLLRAMSVIISVALVRNAFSAILIAHQRFAYTNLVATFLYAEYVVGLVLTVHHHWGLRGVAWTLLVQQAVVTVLYVPASLRYLTARGVGVYRPAELRRFFSYSGKVQLVGLSNLFLQEADVLLVGALLPIRDVAIYTVGANFALQLRTVPLNGLSPMMTVLGQTLGRDGREALVAEFGRLQRVWVQVVAGWCAVGAAAVVFGITAWLGDAFVLSGVIGAVVLIGNLFYLAPSLLTLLLGLLDRPGEEARFSGVMVAANVALTIPLVFVGPVGVAAATAAGQLVAALWIVRRTRSTLGVGGRSFLAEIPVPACLVSAAVVVGLELALHPVVPHGPLGLLSCGAPAAVGLVVYAVLVLGPARARRAAGQGMSRLRGRLA